MRKKHLKIIASLGLLSTLGIGLINSGIDKPILNTNIKATDTLEDVDSRIYPENYKAVYHNRFNIPVISYDANNPGFLGIVQPVHGTTDFPTQITWTGNNLFNSWGQDVTKHPDILKLKGTNNEFVSPIVVGAYHVDDSNITSNFTNQIVIVVGDQSNLQSRKYAFVRYNTISGDTIANPNGRTVLAPSTVNSPIPTANDQGVFAFANLIRHGNNQVRDYLVYYPGTYGQVKNDMFMFTIENNELIFHNNSSDKFAGIRNWPTTGPHASFFDNNNYLMGAYGMSGNDPTWFFEFHVNPSLPTFGGRFSFLRFSPNFTIYPNWVNFEDQVWARGNSNVTGITDSVGRMVVSDRQSFTSHFQPYINAKQYPRGLINISSIVVFKLGESFNFTRIALNLEGSTTFTNVNSRKYTSIVNLLTTSAADPSKRYRPISWINPKNHDEATITYQTADPSTWYAKKIYFRSTFGLGGGDLVFAQFDLQQNTFNSFTKQPWNSITIQDYFNNDIYIFSGATNLTDVAYMTNDNERVNILSTLSGGLSFKNPVTSANANNFLIGQSNAKTPSQITLGQGDQGTLMYNGALVSDILDPGWSQKYLLNRNTSSLSFNTGDFASIPVTIQDNLQRNDTAGIISGNVQLSLKPTIAGRQLNLSSHFNFRLENLKTNAQPTALVVDDHSVVRETFASSITTANVTNYFSLNNLPITVTPDQLQWEVLEPNNRNGYLKVRVTTPQYIDLDTSLKNEPKTFELIINGINLDGLTFKQIPNGTVLVRNNESVADLTVWEVDEETIASFVNVQNTVPGQGINVTYSLSNFSPLAGQLEVRASVTGGYFAGANSLPTTTPDIPLNLQLIIDGFKKVSGITSYEQLEADNTVTPYIFQADPSLLLSYVRIINEVPGSVSTISNVIPSDNGSVTATITSDKVYNEYGQIIAGTSFSLTYTGFKSGVASVETAIDSISNPIEAAKLYAIELDESNISKFVTVINLPQNARVEYKILSTNNISGTANGGSARVSATIDRWFNETGEIIESPQDFPLRNPIVGFKSVTGLTSISPKMGNPNVYPQFFDAANAGDYLEIRNGSEILGKTTSLEISSSTSSYDNFTGRLSFSYQIRNYFNAAGEFISTPDNRTIQIDGFKRVSGPTTLILKTRVDNISNILPSEFDVSDWESYFEIRNLASNTIIPPEGPIISKVNHNDGTGEMTLRIDGLQNFVDKDHVIKPSGSIDVAVKGLKVTPVDNTLTFAIIGGSVGGVIILVLIIGILMWMRINKKNKELLNSKSIPSGGAPRNGLGPSVTMAAPPIAGSANPSIPPVGAPVGSPAQMGPPPQAAYPPGQMGPGPIGGPPPAAARGPSGRPVPPPRK
ncbi:MAG: lipoprotein 17-related variable surface protein [Mycoplasmoidaceae bacterium]